MEIDLTQVEADYLIATEKRKVDDTDWVYPGLGGSIMVPLISVDNRENFILDVTRSSINLEKGSYQNRVRRTVVLVRLCFGDKPHTNPDGNVIEGSHLHQIHSRLMATSGLIRFRPITLRICRIYGGR